MSLKPITDMEHKVWLVKDLVNSDPYAEPEIAYCLAALTNRIIGDCGSYDYDPNAAMRLFHVITGAMLVVADNPKEITWDYSENKKGFIRQCGLYFNVDGVRHRLCYHHPDRSWSLFNNNNDKLLDYSVTAIVELAHVFSEFLKAVHPDSEDSMDDLVDSEVEPDV